MDNIAPQQDCTVDSTCDITPPSANSPNFDTKIPNVNKSPHDKSVNIDSLCYDGNNTTDTETGEQIRHFYPLASRASGAKNPLALMIF